MKTRTRLTLGATGVVASAAMLVPTLATAGHTNPLLEASLNGRNEVVTDATNKGIAGDPNGSGEAYVFGIDGDPTRSTLCYVLTVEGIADLELGPLAGERMAHIHQGPRGANGRVVANLAWPQDGQAADCLDVDEDGGSKFPTEITPADILADPHSYYVNVHNGEYPGGAVRGQLDEQGDHTH